MMIFHEFFRTRYKNEQILSFQSSFFFSTSFGGRPKTKKAEYSKKAKATDITEYMIQSNSTRLYRLRNNQSNMESSSNKSSEKTQDKTQLVENRNTKGRRFSEKDLYYSQAQTAKPFHYLKPVI